MQNYLTNRSGALHEFFYDLRVLSTFRQACEIMDDIFYSSHISVINLVTRVFCQNAVSGL